MVVEPVAAGDEGRYQCLMDAHHYLGALPKIGETLWYAAVRRGEWVALAGFSAAALKCAARDRWIGWDFRTQYDRQHLLANNSRFLVLPGGRVPNLASRVLALCARRAAADWPERFGHPLLLLETFVDPARFRGTAYRAANWTCVGRTRGFRRVRGGYGAAHGAPKLVFVRPLVPDARARMTRPALHPIDRHGGPKGMLPADIMRSLPGYFLDIDDPRRRQGRRHPLHVVLAIAAGATLCGARGYKAMAEWAADLSPRARERFRCRRRGGDYAVPSQFVIRDVLVRVDPDQLDRALQRFHADHGADDDAIAIDGKSMRNAVQADEEAAARAAAGGGDPADGGNGLQTHILSAVGQHTGTTYTQKKSTACRSVPTTRPNARRPQASADRKRPPTASGRNEIGTVVPMLGNLDIDFAGRTFTADALLTQRKLAGHLRRRGAHFVFTAKANQPTLLDDIELFFRDRGEPDFREPPRLAHGRIESRAVWTTTRLNGHLTFPHVGQAFLVERTVVSGSPAEPPSSAPTASPATPPAPPTPSACSPSTADTGPSRPCTTSSTTPSTRTAAGSEPGTAPKTPPGCAASASASSVRTPTTASPPPCAASSAIHASSSTTCA